jgi:hypothetical protein
LPIAVHLNDKDLIMPHKICYFLSEGRADTHEIALMPCSLVVLLRMAVRLNRTDMPTVAFCLVENRGRYELRAVSCSSSVSHISQEDGGFFRVACLFVMANRV